MKTSEIGILVSISPAQKLGCSAVFLLPHFPGQNFNWTLYKPAKVCTAFTSELLRVLRWQLYTRLFFICLISSLWVILLHHHFLPTTPSPHQFWAHSNSAEGAIWSLWHLLSPIYVEERLSWLVSCFLHIIDILLCILCPSCCSIYITSETPKSGSSKVVATKKVSPRKCSPRLGVVGNEDEDNSSDIGEDTMPEVFPSSPISLLSKGTYATHWCILWLEIKIYGGFFFVFMVTIHHAMFSLLIHKSLKMYYDLI